MDKHSVTPSATLPWESGKLPHQGLVDGLPLSDESRQLCSDLFTKLDKNKNGHLEKTEVNRATTKMHSFMPPAARWDWAEMDANKDGLITLTEWLAFFDAKVKDVGIWQEG
jgi:Ca2+-binding EF-hand superfamily protein